MTERQLPVAVIGAGPVGLAAAAHLIAQGKTPLILEAGESVGASILKWGHVKLFTPWRYATDSASRLLLEDQGWERPNEDSYPTGQDLVEKYLKPLSEHPQIEPHLHLGAKVVRIARMGLDKMKTSGREAAPFVIITRSERGEERQYLASAVIDASGTYQTPNPLGGNGIPAMGEEKLVDRFFYGIPDIGGKDYERYMNKTVLVAGSGASAFNVLIDLVQILDRAPQTRIIWLIRRGVTTKLFGGGDSDQLPERGALGRRVRELVEAGIIRVEPQVRVSEVQDVDGKLIVCGDGDRVIGPVDEIVVTTGFRPELGMLSELRLSLDSSVDSPTKLAPMIDPNVHSCGSVPPHGAEELKHPEADFYIAGSKSYGRAPTFLLLTGYEQVRSIAAAIAGDWESARRVELVLPQTGVCSTDPDDPILSSSCCGTPAVGSNIALVDIGVSASGSAPRQVSHVAEISVTQANGGGCCG